MGPRGRPRDERYRTLLSRPREDRKKEPQVRTARFEARKYTYFDDITEQGGRGDPTHSDPEFLEEVVAETTETILSALKSDIEQE